jgi:hypothetical protein
MLRHYALLLLLRPPIYLMPRGLQRHPTPGNLAHSFHRLQCTAMRDTIRLSDDAWALFR